MLMFAHTCWNILRIVFWPRVLANQPATGRGSALQIIRTLCDGVWQRNQHVI